MIVYKVNDQFKGNSDKYIMLTGCKGGACCVAECRKRRKRKNEDRSSSEGSDDEWSELKTKYPRSFLR